MDLRSNLTYGATLLVCFHRSTIYHFPTTILSCREETRYKKKIFAEIKFDAENGQWVGGGRRHRILKNMKFDLKYRKSASQF